MKIPTSFFVALYLIAGFATFGWVFNTTPAQNMCWLDAQGKQTTNCFDKADNYRVPSAIASGFGWPLYWAGTLSIKWVKP